MCPCPSDARSLDDVRVGMPVLAAPYLCQSSGVGTFRALNLGARFLLELCAVAAAAEWGWHTGGGGAAGALLGLVGGGLVVGVWGAVIAARAKRRLPDPQRLVIELMIF